MNHFASPNFWKCYHALPAHIQALADKCFALLQADPSHPSLHFKMRMRPQCERTFGGFGWLRQQQLQPINSHCVAGVVLVVAAGEAG